ncbi:MAG: hypothetical protein HC849_14210 [Oscillatoriales cyanobacterium RU_3_3]|nr:hypothetical protein [Microcoleus sp. SU_5_6]NJL68312.1 hypothetical protein [Microcoleus sp. SM1_3_4]NJM61103.1 hypothetical protein [Oscillatoriales cyanobacterium RU_3_3]NJR23531.1 hypothetical protein [Richelia sp. CSU_2_1]
MLYKLSFDRLKTQNILAPIRYSKLILVPIRSTLNSKLKIPEQLKTVVGFHFVQPNLQIYQKSSASGDTRTINYQLSTVNCQLLINVSA